MKDLLGILTVIVAGAILIFINSKTKMKASENIVVYIIIFFIVYVILGLLLVGPKG